MLKSFAFIIFKTLKFLNKLFFFLTKRSFLEWLSFFLINDCYVEKEINKRKVKFYTPNHLISWRVKTLFNKEPDTIDWINNFKVLSGNNFIFWDIGANIGLYSLYAAKKGHKVIALEPESLNFACLNLNIKDNNFNDKISAFPIAVNNESKISYLNMSKMKFGASGNTFDRKINDHGSQFESIYSQGSISYTLDDVLEKIGTVPNYIKIDVDGNELKVIKGMTDMLKNENLKSICIELNPKFNEHTEVFEILNKNFKKYKKHQWYDGQEVFNYTFDKGIA